MIPIVSSEASHDIRASPLPKTEVSTPSGFGWKAWLSVAALCVGIFLFYLTCLPYPMQRCDDIYYVIGAKSLAAGKGYSDISRPDAPLLTKYAPAPSVTLAPFVNLVGENWRMLRLVPMLWFTASLPLVYALMRQRVSHRGAILILTLYALNSVVLSGITFQGNAALGAFLFSLIVWVSTIGKQRWPSRYNRLLLGVLLAVGFYTHRVYIVIAFSACSYLFFYQRRRREALVVFAIAAALSFPWMLRSYVQSGYWISNEYEMEIAGRIQESASANSTAPSLVQHVAENLPALPDEIGHGLFPWSKASGGHPWPFLEARGLTWIGSVSVWSVFLLVVLGWILEIKNRRVGLPEWHLPVHTAMMLVFFVGFQYYTAFIPWLYLYLWRGAETTARFAFKRKTWVRAPRWAIAGWVILLLPILAKDTKVYWGNVVQGNDRAPRWTQFASIVPFNETIYWQGLSNYAWSCWRWYDSGRLAQGMSDTEIVHEITRTDSPVHYLAIGRDSEIAVQLRTMGWQEVYSEANLPVRLPEVLAELTIAQRQFIKSQPPPQTLWRRPGP